MISVYNKLFDDNLIIKRVKNKLPHLFQLAELESSRNGKIGMEIGSVRERILIALLMYKFGIDIVDPDIPITAPEVDVCRKYTFINKTMTTNSERWNSIKRKVLNDIGRDRYIKLLKGNTNTRGVEITAEALLILEKYEDTRCININFNREKIDYREVYTKWLDAWREDY